MGPLAHDLDVKLKKWKPQVSNEVRLREIIEHADEDTVDLGRSRELEQEVLDDLGES
jgi:hypothetical protein